SLAQTTQSATGCSIGVAPASGRSMPARIARDVLALSAGQPTIAHRPCPEPDQAAYSLPSGAHRWRAGPVVLHSAGSRSPSAHVVPAPLSVLRAPATRPGMLLRGAAAMAGALASPMAQ